MSEDEFDCRSPPCVFCAHAQPAMKDYRQDIMFLIPSLKAGGAERVVVNLLRHLDRSRFRLILAVVDMRKAVFLQDVPQDVEVLDLQCTRVRYAMPKIALLIWRRRPSTVFSTLGHLNLALAVVRRLLPDGVRYVARETSQVTQTIGGYAYSGLWRWAYRRYYRRFDQVVCQSRSMCNDLVGNFGLPSEKAVTIHNLIDVERVLQLATESESSAAEVVPDEVDIIRLVAVGRLSYEKGFDLLIDAVAQCRDARLRLCLVGDGSLRAELQALAVSRGVASQVRFVGFQQNPYPFIANADAFVLSSRFEGFPNVVLEALACGTPVIATPSPGGTCEILDGVEGCVIAHALDSAALASAITTWAKLPRARLAGETLVARYGIGPIVAQYELCLAGKVSVALGVKTV